MSLEEGLLPWEEEIFPKFEEIYNKNNDNWFSQELINKYLLCEQELQKAEEEYKKGHNKFKFGIFKYLLIPISVILLFIPFYWVWKEYKRLRGIKEELISVINSKEKNKLNLHLEIVNSTDFIKIINDFSQVIKYQNMGPIPEELVQGIKANSTFLFEKENYNPYSTSWSILDNKIVLHYSEQTHSSYMKTYTGSTSVSYYNSSAKRTESTVVSANYSHIAYKIPNSINNFMYVQSCSELEFKFFEESGKFSSKSFNKRNSYAPLENKEFDNAYNWYRNDDIQFRMIFTTFTQEAFLKNAGKESIKELYKWSKKKNFIFTNYKTKLIQSSLTDYFDKKDFIFLKDKYKNITDYKKEIFDLVISYYKSIYNSFNFYWLTTVLRSESHLDILHNIKIKTKINDNEKDLFFHYALWLLRIKTIYGDIDTFHKIENYEVVNIGNTEVYFINFNGITYNIVKKYKTVSTYCSQANRYVDVSVAYDDYIPKEGKATVILSLVKNNYHYYYLKNNLITNIEDENILNILNNLPNKVIIKNQMFITYNTDEIQLNLKELIGYLNK